MGALSSDVNGLALAARELEVLQLLVTGERNRAIATTLPVSENTVESTSEISFRKLAVRSQTEAIALAPAVKYGSHSSSCRVPSDWTRRNLAFRGCCRIGLISFSKFLLYLVLNEFILRVSLQKEASEMKRRNTVGMTGSFPAMVRVGEATEVVVGATLPSNPIPVSSAEVQLMAVLVEASSRACAQDVARAQAEDTLATAYRNGPAYVIAQLIDAGKARWVKAFFHSFVRSLHSAEQLVGLEVIRSEAALLAISHHVHGQACDVNVWEGTFRDLEAEVFPGWLEYS